MQFSLCMNQTNFQIWFFSIIPKYKCNCYMVCKILIHIKCMFTPPAFWMLFFCCCSFWHLVLCTYAICIGSVALIWIDLLLNVFSALKGTHFYMLFVVTAAGVVLCGRPKKHPRTSSMIEQFITWRSPYDLHP